MKPRKIYLLVLFPVIGLLSSCGILNVSSGYEASPVFAPLHEKAGEVKASAGYGGMLGLQGNVSYTLTDRLAVMAGGVYNHQTAKTNGLFNPVYFKLRNHYAEGAIGYYSSLNWWIISKLEVFAGLGRGTTNKKVNSQKDFDGIYSGANGTYTKAFLVTTVKIPTYYKFELAFGNRISYLHFSRLEFFYRYSDVLPVIFNRPNTLLTEPVFILNYGKRLKGTGQIGLAIPLSKSLETKGDSYANASGIFQLGLKYNIK